MLVAEAMEQLPENVNTVWPGAMKPAFSLWTVTVKSMERQ
jgi:hypothetical protein